MTSNTSDSRRRGQVGKFLLAGALTVVIALTGELASSRPVLADHLDGYFELYNIASSKCLDDTNWSTSWSTQMQIWDCHSRGPVVGSNQTWREIDHSGGPFGDGHDLLQNTYSWGCLNNYGNSDAALTPAVQWGCNDGDSSDHVWAQTNTINGWPIYYWQIYNDHGLCLDDHYAGTTNGNRVDWYPCNNTYAQAWYTGQ